MRVQYLWDGSPLAPESHVLIECAASGGKLEIRVDSPFYADPPPAAPCGSVPGLWNFEVVEIFVLGAQQRYLEIELGPHGHYWVLQLHGSRHVRRSDIQIEYAARIEVDRWLGTARIPAQLLPTNPCAVNAYAIHGIGDARRYLAAYPVPGAQPDFHRLECFHPWRPPSGL